MDKTYIRKWFTVGGKRYSVYGKTEREAYTKMVAKQKELEEGIVPANGDMTLNEWADKCISTYKTRQTKETKQKYISRVNHCILQHIGKKKLKDIKPLDVQAVLAKQEGNSQYQINQVYQALRFLFRTAKQNELIVKDPTENLVKGSGAKSTRRSMTAEEEKAFLAVCGPERFRAFELMYYCGLRSSEAREAKGEDITEIDGYPVLHIRGTKTANADRNVPIPDNLFNEIKNTLEGSFIAPNERGGRHDDKSFQRAFNGLRRAMNIEMGAEVYRNKLIPPLPLAEDFVPYCLRHTYCTNLCRKKVDIRIAQYLMGHSDIRLTANIYTHADNSDVVEAAKILSKSSAVSSAVNSTI